MHVELKKSSDFLQMQLRRLLREAKKAELELHCIVEGSFDRSINLSQAGLGPFTKQRKERLWLYVRKDHHWSKLHLQIHSDVNLDIPNIMESLRNIHGQHHLPSSKDQKQHLLFAQCKDDSVDNELVNLDFKECADFFRSRFLIDAPNKILFDAKVSTGCNYQAYASEEISLVFQPYSHYGIVAGLRTRTVQIQMSLYGQSLRSMRLANIRKVLSPFWTAALLEPFQESLPEDVILSSRCLQVLAQAALRSQKDGNVALWSWLKNWHGQGNFPIGLQPKSGMTYSPLSQVLYNALERKIHPAGELTTPLDSYLKGEIAGQRLYIQDIIVDIEGANIWITTKGSCLQLTHGKTGVINMPLSFMLTGEKIEEAPCSSQWACSLGFDHTPILVPEYAVLNGLRLLLGCGQMQHS